jgi:hypothetical protein
VIERSFDSVRNIFKKGCGMTTMDKRRRLNLGDDVLVRADELRLGQRFVSTEPWWADEPAMVVVELVLRLELCGDDVNVTTDRGEFLTSIGNTFLVLPERQVHISVP